MFNKCQGHLDTVGESYWQHLWFAASFGLRMIGGGLAAIVHGLCPAFFERTGSTVLFRLHAEVRARQAAHSVPETPPRA